MSVHTFNVMSCSNRNTFKFYSLHTCSKDVTIWSILLFTNCTSYVFITYSFTQHLAQVHICFYILHNNCHNQEDGGVLDYPNQDYINFYAIFHQENIKQDSFNSLLPKFSQYFYTLLISNYKLEITTVSWIYLQDNLILFNLLMQ